MKRAIGLRGSTTLALAILVMSAAFVSADQLTNFTTVSNTDFLTFGVGGMRGQGTGSIVVTGVSGTVTTAYLYWHFRQTT